MLRADGVRVSISSVERALRRQSLLQPRRYLAERRQLAAQRKSVTDNGPAFKSADFVHFIARHPELRHVQTRHREPETNGIIERFNRSLKYDHLYREEIPNVLVLRDEIDAYRELYN